MAGLVFRSRLEALTMVAWCVCCFGLLEQTVRSVGWSGRPCAQRTETVFGRCVEIVSSRTVTLTNPRT
eukprot:1854743-Pleurochrysis_carterae.AAC.1